MNSVLFDLWIPKIIKYFVLFIVVQIFKLLLTRGVTTTDTITVTSTFTSIFITTLVSIDTCQLTIFSLNLI